jgi:hypothetical protein
MSADANEAVRLKEQRDAERGIDAESDEAHPAGDSSGADASPPLEEAKVDKSPPETDDPNKDADKIMPSGDKPRPAHG